MQPAEGLAPAADGILPQTALILLGRLSKSRVVHAFMKCYCIFCCLPTHAQTQLCQSLIWHAVGGDCCVDMTTFLAEEVDLCLQCCYLFALECEQILESLSFHLPKLDQRLCV